MTDPTDGKRERTKRDIETVFQNSTKTHENKSISIQATEILARYEISHIDDSESESFGKPAEEIGIFCGVPQSIPLVSSYIRTEGEPDEVVEIHPEHFIKFESPELVTPLYAKIPVDWVVTQNQFEKVRIPDKYTKFIGNQDISNNICLNPVGDLMGEMIENVLITETDLKVPIPVEENNEEQNVESGNHGIIDRLLGVTGRSNNQPVGISRDYIQYRADRPEGLDTVYSIENGRRASDQELTVTAALNDEEDVCEFTDVKSGEVYQVDLVNGQMGVELTKFFQTLGTDNITGEFTVYKTYFPNENTIDTKTYAVYLRPE